jgi:serine/threonine protein phosphatase PrpC
MPVRPLRMTCGKTSLMGNEEGASRWQIAGRSVRGASHERSGLPNQDAIHWLPESGSGAAAVLAVADGHGSARYTRSHIGARLAVETSTRVIFDFLDSQSQIANASLTKRTAEEWLPKALARTWLAAVSEHLEAHPLAETDLDAVARKDFAAKPMSAASQSLVYGATIIAAAVTQTFVLYLQLGDGEILTVSRQGEVSQPLPKDYRLFANETTSLCSDDAWRDFRVSFRSNSDEPPALILLATDGYPNSFRHESGFLKVGSDILATIREEGLDKVKDSLEQWLRDSTQAGSGDDVTLGLLYFPGAAAVDNEKQVNGPEAAESSLANHRVIDESDS